MDREISDDNGVSNMLVLARKIEESVVVGDSNAFEPALKVTVLGIRGDSVKLGFEAAADIAVHRREVWEKIYAGGRPERSMVGAATAVPSGSDYKGRPLSWR